MDKSELPLQRWKYLPSVSILPQHTGVFSLSQPLPGRWRAMDGGSVTDFTKQTGKDEADYGVTHVPPRCVVSMRMSVPIALLVPVNSGSRYRP